MLFFCLSLAVGAVAAMVWHWHGYRELHDESADALTLRFARQQFVRRMQASFLLVVLAGALYVGDGLKPGPQALLFWIVPLALVVWVSMLALSDLFAIQYHYRQQAESHRSLQRQLETEALRLQAPQTNGRSLHDKT